MRVEGRNHAGIKLAVLIGALVAAPTFLAAPAMAQDVIKIGWVGPLSPFFFFQAEDGIRDFHVTGVKTCALPICARRSAAITTPSTTGKSSTPSSHTPIATAAAQVSPPLTPSRRPVRTNSVRPLPTPSPVRGGTTIQTGKSATSAPGKQSRLATTPSSKSGQTRPTPASD